MHEGPSGDDPQPDPARAQWLERIAAATMDAIGRLREFDDPAHMTLIEDLQAFHDRLVAELEQ
jgi:hypothetical protein